MAMKMLPADGADPVVGWGPLPLQKDAKVLLKTIALDKETNKFQTFISYTNYDRPTSSLS